MKKITLLILIATSTTYAYCQNIIKLQAEIDSMILLKKEFEAQIATLNSRINSLNDQMLILNCEISKYQIAQAPQKKIEAIINWIGGTIYDKPYGNILTKVSEDDTVYVLEEYKKPYLKVIYKNWIGYLSYSSIVKNDKVMEIVYSDLAKTNPRLAQLTRLYGNEIAQKIINGEFWIGMSSSQASESLGYPDQKNLSKGSWGEHEQWVYNHKHLYLYFEDDVLTSYQRND